MAFFYDLTDKFKRYGKFTPYEIRGIITIILVSAFIISFNKWGEGDNFDFNVGMMNFLMAVIIAAITVMVAQFAHRLSGLQGGFRVEYRTWYLGLVIGLIMIFLSRGAIWLILPGGIFIHHMSAHRLGFFRYGTNTFAIGMAALAGPLANIILATAIKTLEVWFSIPVTQIYFLNTLIFFNWAYALYNLLPIPPLPGSAILFQSRMIYAFIFGSVAGYFALLAAGIYSFVFALLIGVVIWLLYYIIFERFSWKG